MRDYRLLSILLVGMFFIMSYNCLQAETRADEESAWESSGEPWAFLKMGVGARAMGMGGAFVAIADDATAPYWNPAGLGLIKQRTATAMYVQQDPMVGIHGYLSYCHPTEEFGNLGISANYFRVDDIIPTIATSDGGFTFNGSPENDNEWALNLSYALSLPRRSPEDNKNPMIFLGTNGRIMGQDFMGYSTGGLGSDLGVIVTIVDKNANFDGSLGQNIPIENFRVGYVLKYNSRRSWSWEAAQDSGTGIDNEYTDPATLGWQLGASSKIPIPPSSSERESYLIIAASVIKTNEGVPLAYALGSELKILQSMAIRIGLRRRAESNLFTTGFGLEYGLIQVDYAISLEPLGLKHRMSLSSNF